MSKTPSFNTGSLGVRNLITDLGQLLLVDYREAQSSVRIAEPNLVDLSGAVTTVALFGGLLGLSTVSVSAGSANINTASEASDDYLNSYYAL